MKNTLFPLGFPVLFEDGAPTLACDSSAGIYCWINLKNQKRYVGMAAGKRGFRCRLTAEAKTSANGLSSSTPLLTQAFKKYGLEAFVAVKLISLTGSSSDVFESAERGFIKLMDCCSPNGYNITEGGCGTLGYSSLIGASKRREVKRPDVSLAKSKRYELVDPNGVRHYITNLLAFSRALGFTGSGLYRVAGGGSKSYKGWTNGVQTKDAYAKSLSNTAFFVCPEGGVFKVKNIKRFALHHGLSQAALNHVWNEKKSYLSHKGWRKASREQIDSFDALLHKTWEHDSWL